MGSDGTPAALGVYQQLATRAGGEVISADGYSVVRSAGAHHSSSTGLQMSGLALARPDLGLSPLSQGTRFMIRSRDGRVLLLLAALPLVGCEPGPPSTTATGPPAPHQGSVIELPGGEGYVEIVQKQPTSPKAPLDKELSFYFLKDMTTPLAPAPTTGTLAVGKKTVALKADGDALVTPLGPPIFPQGDLEGTLSVDLDGGSKTIPLRIR